MRSRPSGGAGSVGPAARSAPNPSAGRWRTRSRLSSGTPSIGSLPPTNPPLRQGTLPLRPRMPQGRPLGASGDLESRHTVAGHAGDPMVAPFVARPCQPLDQAATQLVRRVLIRPPHVPAREIRRPMARDEIEQRLCRLPSPTLEFPPRCPPRAWHATSSVRLRGHSPGWCRQRR